MGLTRSARVRATYATVFAVGRPISSLICGRNSGIHSCPPPALNQEVYLNDILPNTYRYCHYYIRLAVPLLNPERLTEGLVEEPSAAPDSETVQLIECNNDSND